MREACELERLTLELTLPRLALLDAPLKLRDVSAVVPRATGGRSLWLLRERLLVAGPLWPAPCGAVPRSVVFPCADQVRPLPEFGEFTGRLLAESALRFAAELLKPRLAAELFKP